MYKSLLDLLIGFSEKLEPLKRFPPLLWYRNILYSIDLMANSLTLGDPREPISSVLGKMRQDGTCKLCAVFCGILSILFMEKEHCLNSVHKHLGRGTDNDMSPIPGLRRKWSNGFVIIVVLMMIYREELMTFVMNIAT
jgi:hypothetical protein